MQIRSFTSFLALAILCVSLVSSVAVPTPPSPSPSPTANTNEVVEDGGADITSNSNGPSDGSHFLRVDGPSFGVYNLGELVDVQVWVYEKNLLKKNPKVQIWLQYPDKKKRDYLTTICLADLAKNDWYFTVIEKWIRANNPEKYFHVRVVFPWKGKSWYSESEGIQFAWKPEGVAAV